jgi:NTE family protein
MSAEHPESVPNRLPGSDSGKPLVGIALGSGSARGWAHLGVLRALEAEGIRPDMICGCSIGAFVGAAAAMGDLKRLTEWVSKLRRKEVVSLLDVSLRGGLIKGDRLIQFFERNFVDRDFADLPVPFACVATDLQSGRELWLREGSVADAVRASIAFPGLMTPVMRDGHVLVDGGLVNPVPVSLCRAMGAEVVIAVDLGSDLVGRTRRAAPQEEPDDDLEGWGRKLWSRLGIAGAFANSTLGEGGAPGVDQSEAPSLIGVLTTSINIMQVRIARSRLAGDPADVHLSPRVGHLGPMDYHRAAEAIAEGESAVERMLPAIRYACGHV